MEIMNEQRKRYKEKSEQGMGWTGGCKSKEGLRMKGWRWGQSDAKRKGVKLASSSRGGKDKMCGEVMAVMNSLWLISRSQVGVWRLDFNTALWLHSACKIITGWKKKTNYKLVHATQTDYFTQVIVSVCPWWWELAQTVILRLLASVVLSPIQNNLKLNKLNVWTVSVWIAEGDKIKLYWSHSRKSHLLKQLKRQKYKTKLKYLIQFMKIQVYNKILIG